MGLVELVGLMELAEFLGEGGLSGEQLLLHRCFGLPPLLTTQLKPEAGGGGAGHQTQLETSLPPKNPFPQF